MSNLVKDLETLSPKSKEYLDVEAQLIKVYKTELAARPDIKMAEQKIGTRGKIYITPSIFIGAANCAGRVVHLFRP